jgi:deoxyribodipyrimidine photolyase-related protein
MSNSASLIFPHQLYQDIPHLQKDRKIYLVEENLYFQQYNFHQKKLVLHRASMKFYEQFLIKKGL